MPTTLADLVGDGQACVVTMELQRGVVGDLSSFPELAAAVADGGVLAATIELLEVARQVGTPVVHCTAGFRADRAGSMTNAPLLSAVAHMPDHLIEGTPAVDLVPGLGPEPGDIVSHRRHGVAPFSGTSLDATLRALGVTTVIATGVSLNVAVIGLVIEAVDLGYHVVVATDAVAGIPADYAQAVVRHTLPLLATMATVKEITAALGP